MSNLNELAAQIHETAKAKGFWDPTRCGDKFCDTETPRHPAEALLLIGSEVTEAYEAIRDGYPLAEDKTDWIGHGNVVNHTMTQMGTGAEAVMVVTQLDGSPMFPPVPVTDEIYRRLGFEPKPVGVPSELADIIIRTLDTAAAWGIDIDAAIERKMAYNLTRAHKHGRKA